MALSLRQRQIDAVVRMLNLNTPVASGGTADEEVYKILLLDRFCRDIISPLLRVNDLRKHGITLHLMIDQDRQNIPDVPAVYFVQPSVGNVQRIAQDASRSVYDKFHLNFTSSLPRPLLEDLAAGVLKGDAVHRIAKVHDQYLEFVSLESGMFSLAQPQAYVELNDPTRPDKDVESAVEGIVGGLFCVLATLGVVPIIRCPNKGPAEMVARQLDARLRAHLSSPLNLFKDGSHVYQRPLLCLFDRNVDLAVAVQHTWAYRPLVHDVLGMRLNRVLVQQSGAAQGVLKQKANTAYELDDSDQFWVAHASSEFPKAAGEVDNLLRKWTADKDELNKQPGVDLDEDELMGANTKHLTAAMNAVPELVERKRLIDKHINIGGALLEEIKVRSLDRFHSVEEEMLARGTVDTRQVIDLLRTKGSPEDKLRLAAVHLLVSDQPLPADLEAIEGALREGGVDAAAVHYIKQLKRLNQSLTSAQGQGSKDDLLDWAGRFGQSIGQSMKNVTSRILASGRQLVVTRAVEALIEAKPVPEVEAFVMLDPRAAKGSGTSGSASQGRGPFKEAIVFMIGGGNYVEYAALQEFAQRQQPPRNIIYGCTEVVSGKEFMTQLAELGRKTGAGGVSWKEMEERVI